MYKPFLSHPSLRKPGPPLQHVAIFTTLLLSATATLFRYGMQSFKTQKAFPSRATTYCCLEAQGNKFKQCWISSIPPRFLDGGSAGKVRRAEARRVQPAARRGAAVQRLTRALAHRGGFTFTSASIKAVLETIAAVRSKGHLLQEGVSLLCKAQGGTGCFGCLALECAFPC